MALIVQAGDPVLRGEAKPVPRERLGTSELAAIVTEMIATMRAAPGVGLAAPQIGVPWQLIVVEDDEERMSKLSADEVALRDRRPLPLTTIVNPTLDVIGDRIANFFEGCLSVSGWQALVPRAAEVEVNGVTPAGEPLKLRLAGWPARILQHEVDHLKGTLYVDRMYTRTFCRSDSPQHWQDRPAEEVATRLGFGLGAK